MESHAETIAMVMVPGSAELSELAASVAASLVSVPAAAGPERVVNGFLSDALGLPVALFIEKRGN